jgi:hypothetical protein
MEESTILSEVDMTQSFISPSSSLSSISIALVASEDDPDLSTTVPERIKENCMEPAYSSDELEPVPEQVAVDARDDIELPSECVEIIVPTREDAFPHAVSPGSVEYEKAIEHPPPTVSEELRHSNTPGSAEKDVQGETAEIPATEIGSAPPASPPRLVEDDEERIQHLSPLLPEEPQENDHASRGSPIQTDSEEAPQQNDSFESMAQAEVLHTSAVAIEDTKPSSETAEFITATETSLSPPSSPPASAESEDEDRQLLSPIPSESSRVGDVVVDHGTPVAAISDEGRRQRTDSISPSDTSQYQTNKVAVTEDVSISLSPPSRHPTPTSPETPKAPTNLSRPRRLSHLRSRSLPSPLSEELKISPSDGDQQRHTIHDLHGNIRFSVEPSDTLSTELEVPELPFPLSIYHAYCSCSHRVLLLVLARDLPLTHPRGLYIFDALFLWPISPLPQISTTTSGIRSPFPAAETRM